MDCLLRGSLRSSRRSRKEPLRLQNSSRTYAEQPAPESELSRKPFKEPTNLQKGPLRVTLAEITQSLKPYALLCRPSLVKTPSPVQQKGCGGLAKRWVIKRNVTITKYGVGLLAPERPRWFHKNLHIQISPTKCYSPQRDPVSILPSLRTPHSKNW
jgi:hypothetical protein